MAVLVVFALYNQTSLPTYWMIIVQGESLSSAFFSSFISLINVGFLIAIGVIATLASLASKVSISKDWVVALYGGDRQNLTSKFIFIRFLLCF